MSSLKDDQEAIEKLGTKKRRVPIVLLDIIIIVGFILLALWASGQLNRIVRI